MATLWQTNNTSEVDKALVWLSNVDNTSDANKPVSSATTTALWNKEDSANKSTNITTDTGSTTKYPDVNATEVYVTAWLATKENSFTKNTGFNKDLWTTAWTVSEWNHTHSTYVATTEWVTSVAWTPTWWDRVSKIISLTQAEYDAATKDSATFYIITN